MSYEQRGMFIMNRPRQSARKQPAEKNLLDIETFLFFFLFFFFFFLLSFSFRKKRRSDKLSSIFFRR